MDKVKHCALCEHQRVNFKEGSVCELTNLKPDFIINCGKIEMKEKFEIRLKETNVALFLLKKDQFLTYLYFALYLIIALCFVIGGYFLGAYVLENGVFSTVPLIIMLVGLVPLGIAFGTLNSFNLNLKMAKIKKNEIDEVLKAYGIEYDVEIELGRKYHGIYDVSFQYKLQKK
jgi:magnesium-transporting ATPase (P-type)